MKPYRDMTKEEQVAYKTAEADMVAWLKEWTHLSEVIGVIENGKLRDCRFDVKNDRYNPRNK